VPTYEVVVEGDDVLIELPDADGRRPQDGRGVAAKGTTS
jgi:hypothetical protein